MHSSSFLPSASGTPVLVFDGATTDPLHTIRLTVDEGFRHNGTSGGTVVDNRLSGVTNNPSTAAILVQDDHVTVEWLEVRYGGCSTTACADGVRVSGQVRTDNQVVIRSLAIHDIPDASTQARAAGVRVSSPAASVDVYNTVMWQIYDADGVRLEPKGPWDGTSRVRILNNSIRFSKGTGQAAYQSAEAVNTNVLLRNNIAYNSANESGATGFIFNGSLNTASSHNLSSSNDTTGPAHSPAGAALTRQTLGAVSWGLVLFLAVPAVGALLFFTVVGLPASLVMLGLLLPLAFLAGFTVSAVRLGRWVLRSSATRPYGAAALGSLLLLVVGLVPVAGQILVLLAGMLGAGALLGTFGGGAPEKVTAPGPAGEAEEEPGTPAETGRGGPGPVEGADGARGT